LNARFVQLDVVDESQIDAAKAFVDETFGTLDVLVNNAGIMLEHDARTDFPVATWRETFETNLFGSVAVTNAFLPLLEKSDAPRVVNVSAILGSLSEISKPQMKTWIRTSYSASKAGLNAFTIALAQQKSGSNFKINAAHPGWAKTEMGGPQAPMTPAQSVKTIVQLATLPADGQAAASFIRAKR
jgi:NAD(P)-dependent dehydrogenase (short-subunit alcohol dehydrogenase family)